MSLILKVSYCLIADFRHKNTIKCLNISVSVLISNSHYLFAWPDALYNHVSVCSSFPFPGFSKCIIYVFQKWKVGTSWRINTFEASFGENLQNSTNGESISSQTRANGGKRKREIRACVLFVFHISSIYLIVVLWLNQRTTLYHLIYLGTLHEQLRD